MRLNTLDKILTEVLTGWRKGLGRCDADTLTTLLEDDQIADEVMELRRFIGELRADDESQLDLKFMMLLNMGLEQYRASAELLVHPERYYYDGELPREYSTGILVRAKDPDKRWGNYDIGQLTLASLTRWLQSSGHRSPLAENTLAAVLGHDLNAEDNRQGKNGRGPLEYQQEQDSKAREANEKKWHTLRDPTVAS